MAIFSRPKYVGTALPAISETVTLYTTPAIAGQASNFFASSNVHKVVLDLKNDQSGTLSAQKSADGGTTWVTIYSETITATGVNAVIHREYPVEGIQDFRLRWVNDATAQTTFIVDVALSDNPLNFGTDPTATSGLGTVTLADGSATFGTAAAPADAKTNASAASGFIQAFPSLFNGTTWDRFRSAVVTVSATLTGFANTLPWALYHLAPVTRTDGQGGPIETDATGNLRVSEQNVVGWTAAHISTATTTTVKSGAGVLHRIVIGTIVGAATITVYDNTAGSGTVIGVLTLPAAGAGDMPDSLEFNVAFATGLTLVTSGATDLTVAYL